MPKNDSRPCPKCDLPLHVSSTPVRFGATMLTRHCDSKKGGCGWKERIQIRRRDFLEQRCNVFHAQFA